MGCCEGISIHLESPDGTRYLEYENPQEERHDEFDGTLGSRRFSAVPGTLFVVVLELKGDFKLYRATGLMIIIVIGDESSQRSRHNNTQAFWIDANQLSIQRTYRFTTFTVWENRESATPSGTAALEIPQPKRKSTD